MNFQRRVWLYLIGVMLGMALVTLFFRDRMTEQKAGDTLKSLRQKALLQDSITHCWLDCFGYTEARVDSFLHKGRLVFDGSKARGKGRDKYRVRTRLGGDSILMADLQMVDSLRFRVISLRVLGHSENDGPCDCRGNGRS